MIVLLLRSIIIILLSVNICFPATLYMGSGETYTNLQAAMAAMSSNDTLIIRDGTYTGATNVLDYTHFPPSGSGGNYTIIRAETDGGVIFDGEDARQMFSLYGSDDETDPQYIQFEGIEWCNSNDDIVEVVYADYIKFIRCAAWDAVDTGAQGDAFLLSHGSYFLLEECWSWGSARKHFYIANSAEKVIVRRCVARHDRHLDYADQECFMAYDSWDVHFQNCVAIDSDQQSYYTPNDDNVYFHAFTTRNGGTNIAHDVYYDGCIGVGNTAMSGMYLSSGAVPDIHVSNHINWDSRWGLRLRDTDVYFDHCTLGNVNTTSGTWSVGLYLEGDDDVTNTLLYTNSSTYYGIYESSTSSDYNCLYGFTDEYYASGNAVAGSNDISVTNENAIDPIDGTPGNGTVSLLYLLRIEDGSDLDGAANDAGDIGATVVKKHGTDGTMYGDTGWNTLSSEDLWPFPNEDLIRTKMKGYTWDDGGGGDPEITGDRGFCANGQTLTKYIWEYLGNSMPAGLYNNASIGSGATCKLGSGATVQIQ